MFILEDEENIDEFEKVNTYSFILSKESKRNEYDSAFLNDISMKLSEINMGHRRIIFEGRTIGLCDEKSSPE